MWAGGDVYFEQLKNVTNKENTGLYRDNGLRIFQNKPKTVIKRKKKQIVKVIKDCSLSITIKCNSKSVNFLDATFNLVK